MSVAWYWPDWKGSAPDHVQSETACCPRETVPDSCSCPDDCDCMCLDCLCENWGDDE